MRFLAKNWVVKRWEKELRVPQGHQRSPALPSPQALLLQSLGVFVSYIQRKAAIVCIRGSTGNLTESILSALQEHRRRILHNLNIMMKRPWSAGQLFVSLPRYIIRFYSSRPRSNSVNLSMSLLIMPAIAISVEWSTNSTSYAPQCSV